MNILKDYVDAMEDNHRSTSTLFNYLLDYQDFFRLPIRESIAKIEKVKDIDHEVLAPLPLELARAYFKILEEEYDFSKYGFNPFNPPKLGYLC
ncbi:MAG TPA: hypothetical protein VEY70_24225 [Metabacillus sp.]|nr:hypothetical protein [Metabacillus sp.]